MKKNNPFRGAGTALVTPFLSDGSIDFKALSALVKSQIEGKTDFLCVLGTTAETSCLSQDEQQAVMNCVREVNQGRLPLLLGLGGNCTANVCERIQHTDLTGFDGILVVAPYYNKPSQEGLYQHYRTVCETSPLPVVIYNVPGRTGVNIEAATTLRIATDCPNAVAVKEASGNVAQIEKIILGAPEGFELLCGDDGLAFTLCTLGAKGVISVVSNAYPVAFADLTHAAIAGETEKAREIHRQLHDCYPLLFCDGNPAGMKSLLHVLGRAENVLRLPLVPVSAATYAGLEKYVATHPELH